jgi:hypothetical protein
LSEVIWADWKEESDLPAKAKKMHQRCVDAGWMTAIRQSEVLSRPEPNKTGPKAGIAKPEKLSKFSFLVGWTEGIWFQAVWNGGSFVEAVTRDPVGVIWEEEDGKVGYAPGRRFVNKFGEFQAWFDVLVKDEEALFED